MNGGPMNEAAELTALWDDLAAARIRVTADGAELRVSAAKGALTPELRDRLRAHKPGLLAHLTAEARAAAPITPLPRDGRTFPLSAGQEALWLLDQVEGHQPTYVISGGVRLTGALRPELMVRCLTLVANRHEALRTAYRSGPDGSPEQVVLAEAAPPVRQVDLSALPEGERAAELARIARESAREPFDLAEGRMLRALLVTTAPDEAYLVLSVHHIAADAGSLSVLFRELFALYEADAEPASLPPLSVHYADAAEWQRATRSPVAEHRRLDYWKRQLDGAPPLLELPTDRPRPARQSFRGGLVDFAFGPEDTARITDLAGRARVTPYVLLLACWAAVLARHAGADEVVVGTPVSNRERPEAASLVGFFVGTLPLRVDLTGDPTFTELLGRVQRTFLDGFEQRDVPFQRIVAELQPQRSLSHAPVFQNMLTYYETPYQGGRVGELEVTREGVHNGTAKFDLTLFAEDRGASLDCSLEYAEDLFDRSTAERLAAAFQRLTRAALEQPDTPVHRLPLLTADQREELQTAGRGEVREIDLDRPVHRYLTEQARLRPEATALAFGAETLSYAELEAESNRLARLLTDRGVTHGALVGLYAHRSVRQLVAMLAILKAGAAFLPLDPQHPAERTAEMLAEAGCPVVLADAPLDVPADATLLRLDTLDWSGQDAAEPAPATGRDDLIYVIYTSGSTGRPKGIAMRHGALANLLAWQTRAFPFAEDDRVLQFSPLHFDICMMETFGTWAAGGTVVLVDADTRRDALRLLPYLDEQGITRLFLPYVALQQLAEVGAARRTWPTALREVFTAGEQLHATAELRAFFERTGAALHNQYGPSEAHVITSHTLPAAPADWEALPPVGRPVDNARIYLLDPHGTPVPRGVAGELCVAGDCLARGYLHREDLTAERFVPDPFHPGERMYRTGDLARYRADGELEYLGRIDHQVKVRGFRVEPGEIEAALLTHPGVKAAVVEARGTGAAQALIAWVVAADGEPPSVEALRRYCADRLPEYMVPTVFVPLDALPLTVAGKVERRRLPEPEHTERGGTEPSTPLQKSVAAVFAEVLGVREVAVEDDFFRLGGHSLAVTRAALRLSEEHGVDVTAQVVFAHPTVAGVAESLETLLWAADGPSTATADADDVREEGEL
ncbi:non-ribosomal peptide synthetase [Streptomyces sp. SAJ15]|uniref:non-ribosomal peptide synthetase n=1 Tax=Streptomyces sp. SAJ15 TaxID=2011095 RepID=UPI0011858905|nr:non-ribosomal peptide synthetase [Streptomyces sp. SAJ15]